MKKFVLLLISILILLSGCGSKVQPIGQEIQKPTEQVMQKPTAFAETTPTVSAREQTENIKQVIPLKDLPKDYPIESAIANGDYVRSCDGITNNDAMEDFIKKVSNKENASIRTVLYTDEGDPLITDFLYEDSSFKVTYDATRDKFGGISEITTKTFKNLATYQTNGKLVYFISDLDKISAEDFNNGFDNQILKFDDISK